MTLIMFVDDECRRMSTYVEACAFVGYEVRCIDDVDDVCEDLSKNLEGVGALVLDVMMPVGARFRERPEAEWGVRTGLLLYADIRREKPSLPIILLTQSTDLAIDSAVEKDRLAMVVRKQDLLPFDLPDLLNEFCGSAR